MTVYCFVSASETCPAREPEACTPVALKDVSLFTFFPSCPTRTLSDSHWYFQTPGEQIWSSPLRDACLATAASVLARSGQKRPRFCALHGGLPASSQKHGYPALRKERS